MPRFYFDFGDGRLPSEQSESIEFATISEAELDAALAVARMMLQAILTPKDLRMQIVIRDEARTPVACVTVSLEIRDDNRVPDWNSGGID